MLKPILSAAFFNTIAPGYKCSIEELFQILLKIAAKTYASESLLGKVSKCWFLDYLWIAAFISVESTDFFFKKIIYTPSWIIHLSIKTNQQLPKTLPDNHILTSYT